MNRKRCPVCNKLFLCLRSHFASMWPIGKWTGRNDYYHKAHRYYWELKGSKFFK